ncbi:hypothetical protein, partial [Marinilactibacillus psychrotolerans]|uniref:hypothetical protein n=1 Tax=Marinilactibacillus psychrotolerans TaxID=191770 RepID=UPI00380798EA
TEGFFYLAIVLEWLFRPQQVALCYAFVGSFFHIRGSIRPQYSKALVKNRRSYILLLYNMFS